MLINRDEAIAAVEGLKRDPPSMLDGIYNVAILQASEALRALPVSGGVTDEMVERAARSLAVSAGLNEVHWPDYTERARAALEAALGPLPAPPTIEGDKP